MRLGDIRWHSLLRPLLLSGLALCGLAQAATSPRLELTATPAWQGWSRPGRSSEIDIRISSDSPLRAKLELRTEHQTVHSEIELQPGRVVRLHVPVSSVGTGAVRVALAGAPSEARAGGVIEQRELAIAQSESPLLGLGLAAGGPVELEGFHSVELLAQDLPRNASAYSSIDALILDEPTLAALDRPQLAALLAHGALCGRIVLLNPNPGVRQALESEGGCARHTLMVADSLGQARQLLSASLATSLPPAMAATSLAELSPPAQTMWTRLAVALAVYFALALLMLLYFTHWSAPLLVSALATAAVLALLHILPPPSQLRVWSEGESGGQLAQYQAWQQFSGQVRKHERAPIPPQLAAAVQPCDPTQSMRFDFDAKRGHLAFAEFETRLFRQVRLCYSGSFPMVRALTSKTLADGLREVRNVGTTAWPAGLLLAQGRVHALPAASAGARVLAGAPASSPPGDAVRRTAMARIRPDPAGVAALWPLELVGVADAAIDSQGWLLMSVLPR